MLIINLKEMKIFDIIEEYTQLQNAYQRLVQI